jgi:glucose/arabinose dehydrogenase
VRDTHDRDARWDHISIALAALIAFEGHTAVRSETMKTKLEETKTRVWVIGIIALAASFGMLGCDDDDDGEGDGDGRPVVELRLVADGLTSPVALKPIPDGTGRMAVVDQIGQILIIDDQGELLATPFLDIRDKLVELTTDFDERGLLGLAFHPDYSSNGLFYVYYSMPLRQEAPQDFDHTSVIAEYSVSVDSTALADPESERVLLYVDEPQFNHNAGQIAFGPEDGYLYIPLGDGGGANDVGTGHVEDWYAENEGGNGQDISDNLLGSILRIDVDTGDPYGVPDTNPFVGDQDVLPEIWAYGFRNPFRISFDMGGDHRLFVGDAGQNIWEEVSVVEAGGNYGWNVKEGTHCFSTENPDESPSDCPDSRPEDGPLIDPVIEYLNANQTDGIGLVVIGGHVYRGSAIPDLQGRYVFGDWSASFGQGDGTLFVATERSGELWEIEEMEVSGGQNGRIGRYILSFGQDEEGEIYVLTTQNAGPTGQTGAIHKLVPPTE